jgi:hypothetical protein
MTDPQIIASKLTKWERKAILDMDGNRLRQKYAIGPVVALLIERKLLMPRVSGQELDGRFTRLGLAVRTHLEKESKK